MRGSPTADDEQAPTVGIIPAGAGLTRQTCRAACATEDHPRGCGAHRTSSTLSARYRGSSPRVRGSPRWLVVVSARRGIIPAGAGLTPVFSRYVSFIWDHPRGCGAHFLPVGLGMLSAGSSPRVRGSHWAFIAPIYIAGIIPAGAGLTPASNPVDRPCRDHPRGCGAHAEVDAELVAGWGSSPRVRGSQFCGAILDSIEGIIPAGAGLTYSAPQPTLAAGDHPRGCGAHGVIIKLGERDTGSSPRVRGSPLFSGENTVCRGIIPAGAGLTEHGGILLRGYGDYPRGCGAHSERQHKAASKKGSSPRVRGSYLNDADQYAKHGIIPAGAGLTNFIGFLDAHVGDHPRGCGAHVLA